MESSKPVGEMTTGELTRYVLARRPWPKEYVTLIEGKLADARSVEIVLEMLTKEIQGLQEVYDQFQEAQKTRVDISNIVDIAKDYEVLCEIMKRTSVHESVSLWDGAEAPGISP